MSDIEDDLILAAISRRKPSRAGWIRANCPMCELTTGKPDKRQSLGLHVESGAWHCFKCDERGRLQEGAIESFDPTRVQSSESSSVVVPPWLPGNFVPLWKEPGLSSLAAAPAIAYLLGRGVPRRMITVARIGACLTGPWGNRIVIPIDDVMGRLAGWVSRTWQKKGDYRYMPGMQRANLIYNAQALLVETDRPALVVEGVMDTFPFWPNAVAILGKPSEQQMDMFVAAKRPIVSLFDGDAWRAGMAMALQLRFAGQRAGAVDLPPGKDPDEVPIDRVWEEAYACLG